MTGRKEEIGSLLVVAKAFGVFLLENIWCGRYYLLVQIMFMIVK